MTCSETGQLQDKGDEVEAVQSNDVQPIGNKFVMRVFIVFAVLALISLALSLTGKYLGHTIQMAGHSGKTTVHSIHIGNNTLAVPANMIRFDKQRGDGVLPRLDLYLRWPDMSGYSDAARNDFNHVNGSTNILFLSFQERSMSRDMSGRLQMIYQSLIVTPGTAGPAGLTFQEFKPITGYTDEILVTGSREGAATFVARCLNEPAAKQVMADCERDIHLGDDLSLLYRFPKELLSEWRKLDAAVQAIANRYLQGN